MNFVERFARTVDNNQSLNNADKLAYMEKCLESETAETTDSLSISENNYVLALEILRKR